MIMPIQRRGGAADGTQDADVRLLVLYEDAPGFPCTRRSMLLITACRFFAGRNRKISRFYCIHKE